MGLKALVSTVPFASLDSKPLIVLGDASIEVVINPLGRRLAEEELMDLIAECDILIAGTEPITSRVLNCAPHLKLIARVGIGLDNVDLINAREQGILVTYTPDAPAPAVAELALGHILTVIRHAHVANLKMHRFDWERLFGHRISELTVGVMGAGRIGGRVVRLLTGVGCGRILVSDPNAEVTALLAQNIEHVSQEILLEQSDVVTLHIPLTRATRNLIGRDEIFGMREGSFLVNTSRGGVLDEDALVEALVSGHLAGAALDVFSDEPYTGRLSQLDNCLLTCHMGSMSQDCRARMELEAVMDVVRFAQGEPLANLVPNAEYEK